MGTCKHLEFTLGQLEKKRGAKAAFARGYQPAFSELYLRNDGRRRVHFRAGTDCPQAVVAAAAALFDAADGWALPDDRFGQLERFLATVAKTGHELRAYDDALDFVAGRRDAEHRGAKVAPLSRAAPPIPSCARLKGRFIPIRPKVRCLLPRGPGLIGDEMGLGKTIQAIAAAEILARDAA